VCSSDLRNRLRRSPVPAVAVPVTRYPSPVAAVQETRVDTLCPFRYVHRGRTFCHLALDERKYTTVEVVPSACSTCRVPGILASHACRHMSFGVEVDGWAGRLTAETYHVSCEAQVVRLFDFSQCGKGVCEHWEEWSAEEAVRRAAAAAEEDRRAKERAKWSAECEGT